MKDFPVFETLMSSLDVKKELMKYSNLKEKQREEIASAFGINIMVEKALPPNSALFIDHKNRIVAIFKDGELVYSPRKDGENCDLRYPTALKKREVENRVVIKEAS